MPPAPTEPTYSQREVMNMLVSRLPQGEYTWMRDPEGNPAVEAYGSRPLPSQPVYVLFRPSVVKMLIRFTPRRISPSREAEIWEAAEAARLAFRGTGATARRQKGNTQETERDEQWVVTLPERLTEPGYDALQQFVLFVGSCMGIEYDEE